MSAPSAWLRSLAAEATPGPWKAGKTWNTIQGQRKQEVIAPDGDDLGNSWFSPRDARLIALAPDLAVLCADAIDALTELLESDGHRAGRQLQARRKAQDMLARFAALQPGTGPEEGERT